MNDIFRFQVIESLERGSFLEQLGSVKRLLRNWMNLNGLTPAQLLFSRVYLTDAANQSEEFLSHPLYSCYLSVGAVSCIEQPLLSGAKVAVQLCFCLAPDLRKIGTPDCLEAFWGDISFFFHSVRFKGSEVMGMDGNQQTQFAFKKHIENLQERGMNLKDHCHRTWLFVRDIDRHYTDVVEGRNVIFEEEGLTPSTHFIASTGIGGVFDNKEAIVAVDFLSIKNVKPSDVSYLKALDYLNPTHEYGVAFERGTRVNVSDTSLYFISGTASIDKFGQCVHRGDVLTQTGRLFLNIEKLLNDGGSTLSDLQYMIVYLRDVADYHPIQKYIHLRFPNVPALIVEARVCRPEWLIEVECVATRSLACTR